jgi:hypothetical protein
MAHITYYKRIAVLALLVSAGCLHSGVPGGPNDGSGRAVYAQKVQATLASKCGSSACHSGTANSPMKFLGADPGPSDDYAEIISHPEILGAFDPTTALILTYVKAGHQGATYSKQDEKNIADWLAFEKERTKNIPVDPIASGELGRWASCMTETNWNTADMGSWADKESSDGPCQNCHFLGQYRFNTAPDSLTMFEMNRTDMFVISFFTLKTENDGTVSVIPAYDKLVRMGSGITNHATYNVDITGDVYFKRLTAFHKLTQEACGS